MPSVLFCRVPRRLQRFPGAPAGLRLAAAVAFMAVAAAAAAPAWPQEVPASVDPGQIERRFDTKPRLREAPGPEIEAPAVVPGVVREAEVRFRLTGVRIEGATVFAAAEFAPLYQPLLSREVTLAEMADIAGQITARYQAAGYVLSRAAAPDEIPADGAVLITVIEGSIEEVAIEGEVAGDAELLEAYGDKIAAERPTTIATLERYVLLISDLPGVTVQPLLEPLDAAEGTYRLVLVMRQTYAGGFAQADNRGSKFIGPYQLQAGGVFNTPFGLYDTARLAFATTAEVSELVFVNGAYTLPIGSEGTSVSFEGSYDRSSPGFTLGPLDIHSHSLRLELHGAHPVVRSRNLDVYATARFTYRNSISDRLGMRAFEDRLRVLRGGAVVSFDDSLEGRDWISLEVSQGLDVLGASPSQSVTTSDPSANTDFTKATLDFSRYQRVGEAWGLLVLAAGQYASGALLAAEEMGLGGERFGRAYDPSEITGAEGLAGRAEIQRDFWPEAVPVNQIQLYGFYDIGEVWNPGRQSLSSLGGGVRAQFPYGFFAYVEIAKPLTRSVLAEGADGKDPRFFFVVRADF